MVAVELRNFNDNTEPLIPNYIKGKCYRTRKPDRPKHSPHNTRIVCSTFSSFPSLFFLLSERNQTNHRPGVDIEGNEFRGTVRRWHVDAEVKEKSFQIDSEFEVLLEHRSLVHMNVFCTVRLRVFQLASQASAKASPRNLERFEGVRPCGNSYSNSREGGGVGS